MTGGGIDRRGPKDSENAHNSFLTKCTEKGFWIFATDIIVCPYFSGSRSSKTFKPKKNIPEGSHQHDLMKHAAATLGSGNLR